MSEQITRVLLVEDDESHVDLISRAFESHADAFQLEVANSLEEARAHLAEDQPDLLIVIADIRLPDGLGTDLL